MNSTPTMFVNGEKIAGAAAYSEFEEEVQGAAPPERSGSGGCRFRGSAQVGEQYQGGQVKITRIRIAGFKSFAEATVLVEAGLTGIVGPNGCGKSNVVEALRWAMGETSARSMRGGEMDDVIFAGTATRPGRNLAEVTLYLEEADGLAPPPNDDAEDLEIIRRIDPRRGLRLPGQRAGGPGARRADHVRRYRLRRAGPRPWSARAGRRDDRRQAGGTPAGAGGGRRHQRPARPPARGGTEAAPGRDQPRPAEDLLGQLESQRQGLQRQARQANRYRNLSGLVRQAEAMAFHLRWRGAADACRRPSACRARPN